MRSNDALFYNYVYIPYQDTTQVLNIIVSRYGKTSDKELILCGSGEYIFLLEDDKKARTLIIQQFCTKEHLPEDITSLLKHNPLPDTRYQRALERLFPIE
jgi:hypothetical protein